MKVIVLAAGRSLRLKPIEDKNFLEFLGKPLIQLQLEQMAAAGLEDFIVVGGAHNLGKLRALAKKMANFGDGHGGKREPLRVRVVEQKNLDEGMAGAVMSAERLIGKDSVLVVSANDVVDVEAYRAVLAASRDKKFEAFLIGKKVREYFPGGYLKVRAGGVITGIVEKPGKGNEPSKMVNLVVHFHRSGDMLVKALKAVKTSRDDRYEVALDSLMKAGIKMKVVPYEGFWQAVKYPWHVLDLMDYFLSALTSGSGVAKSKHISAPTGRMGKNVTLAKTATITGNVYLDDGVRVLDNAVIVGPAYIGKNSIVATNALVRGSNIGANCIVGFSTEVARSFWGHDVWTHTNYVGDSVLGNDVSFGSGTVTGNLRLDERNITATIQGVKTDSGRNKFGLFTGDHVRCGINTSFMPGIKIGNNSFVGAGITVAQDIPDNTFVYGKTELIFKENRATVDVKGREVMKRKLKIINYKL